MKIQFPDNIALDKYGLLFNGERLPFAIAIEADGSTFARVGVEQGIARVSVTFLADSVTISPLIEVDSDGRVCLRSEPEFEGVAR